MNFEGILQLIMDNYSSFIATLALLLSALTFIMSQRHTKKNKIISDERYYEQRKQYEERLEVESERREEDRHDTEEKLRLGEKPRFVFKGSKFIVNSNTNQELLLLKFTNKGRDTAYDIIPDLECVAKQMDMTEFKIRRYEPVQDPVVMVGEDFEVVMKCDNNQADFFMMELTITYQDASGRTYKQTFCINITDRLGNSLITNYAQPVLCSN